MAIKTPIKATFTGSDVTGLAEFQSGDSIGVAYGGTGANTLTGLVVGNGVSAFTAVTDGTNGQVLTTNGAGTYSFQDAGANNVASLTDVTLTSLADGQILKYDAVSGQWVNAADAGGIALTDLSVTTAAAGTASLSYNDANGVFTYTPPDLSGYLTSYTETNDLTTAVTWANVPDVNITQTSVTQHQAALSITESQISDLGSYIELTNLSVGTNGTASASGSLAYNNTNGVFTYTPPDLSSYLTSETTTSLTYNSSTTILSYTDETGSTTNINLSGLLDEDARAIASGSLNSTTGIVTFTRDDASTFTLDLGPLLDDTNLVTSVNGQAGVVVLDTDDVNEGSTNLYYTDARADARVNLQTGSNLDLSSKTTTDLAEGTNLYYTDARVNTHLNTSTATANDMLVWNGSDYAWSASAAQNSLVSSNTTHTITLEDTGELTLQSDGALVNDTAALTTTSANQTIDTFAISEYRTAKYVIQGISNSDVHATEVLITHDDSTVYTTEYATIFSNASLFTVTASISSGNVVVTVTPANAGTTIDYTRMCLISRNLGIQGDLSTQSGTEDLQSGSGIIELN